MRMSPRIELPGALFEFYALTSMNEVAEPPRGTRAAPVFERADSVLHGNAGDHEAIRNCTSMALILNGHHISPSNLDRQLNCPISTGWVCRNF